VGTDCEKEIWMAEIPPSRLNSRGLHRSWKHKACWPFETTMPSRHITFPLFPLFGLIVKVSWPTVCNGYSDLIALHPTCPSRFRVHPSRVQL
jgi:hypothetical protein